MSTDLVLRDQVETLYRGAATSDQEFCIDLEGEAPDGRLLWKWAYLSTAGNARRSVEGKKQLIQGEHYLVIRSEKQVPHQGGMRSTEVVRIVFSREGFELWLLMLDTARGHEIRQYFRECHKRLQLGMSQPTTLNGALQVILERQQALAENLAGHMTQGFQQVNGRIDTLESRVARIEEQNCDQLYVFVRSADLTVKIGYSQDLDQRRKQHEARGFRFVGAMSGTHKAESRIKASLRTKGFKPKNGTEEYQLMPELVEALAQEGLPVGDLCCTRPPNALQRRKHIDTVTPTLNLWL